MYHSYYHSYYQSNQQFLISQLTFRFQMFFFIVPATLIPNNKKTWCFIENKWYFRFLNFLYLLDWTQYMFLPSSLRMYWCKKKLIYWQYFSIPLSFLIITIFYAKDKKRAIITSKFKIFTENLDFRKKFNIVI